MATGPGWGPATVPPDGSPAPLPAVPPQKGAEHRGVDLFRRGRFVVPGGVHGVRPDGPQGFSVGRCVTVCLPSRRAS